MTDGNWKHRIFTPNVMRAALEKNLSLWKKFSGFNVLKVFKFFSFKCTKKDKAQMLRPTKNIRYAIFGVVHCFIEWMT